MRIVSILIVMIAMCVNSIAQPPSPKTPMKNVAQFQADLREMTQSTQTISAEFKQEKKLKVMRQPIVSNGYIHFMKPQNLKWAYTTPFEYAIVLNGEEIIIDDAGNVNAIALSENQLFSDLSNMIIQSVEGSILEDSRFDKSYFEEAQYNIVTLSPTESDMQSYLQSMTLYFDKSDFTVRQIVMQESEGNYTILTFQNPQLNIKLDPSEFKKP